MIFQEKNFQKAIPIWEKGTQKQMNRTLLFCVKIPFCENAVLSVTGHSNYQIFINREFVFYGPARAGKGCYRVDEISISSRLTLQQNDLVVVVNGYNCSSFYTLNEPSFLCEKVA